MCPICDQNWSLEQFFNNLYVVVCKVKTSPFIEEVHLAGELGFEPRLTESESAVLPLNDSPIVPFSGAEIYLVQNSYKIKKGKNPLIFNK